MPSASKFKERYEIREELGAGGMGAVYRAFDKVIKTEVALKTLLDIHDAQSLRMFHEECDKLAKMVHPNVVEIRDIGELNVGKGKQPYLVMPLLRGKTLDQHIKDADHRLSVSRAVDILCQACRGLQAAHDAGLIHRDLKPSNIFVLEDDSVKLIDFGVAHSTENKHTVGRKGTLLFMAPEQIEMKGISPSSDIFSLGVVAYQALTGRSPFERRLEDEVVKAILHYVPPPASEYNSDVSLALSQAVHKAMAKQPSNRYRNAREFGDVLQKALHEQPIELFNPARIRARVERANQALEKDDLELASEIVAELDAEGYLDPQVLALQRNIEQLSRRKRVTNLLEGARARLREQEYPLALQKIQEALELDKSNNDALALKESVEIRRADQSVSDWLQLARQHIDNFAHDRAREALQNVLQLKPNDARATAMLTEVEKSKADYQRILTEKQKLFEAARMAFGQGEVSNALSKMDRVLQLDKRAPDRTGVDGSTRYQNFYQQIRSEYDDLQNAYAEARALQVAGDYSRALAICNDNLIKHPGQTLFQALKLDLEVSQRQQISGFIADVDRRVDGEPDLDKRLSILQEAIEKFPEVEHFQSNYRLAREKRDLIESIVSKAHLLEEHNQINDALAQWEVLRSIYDRYPGIDFEFQRLRKRQAHLAKSEARAHAIEKIEEAMERKQFGRALELIEEARKQNPEDSEFQDIEADARSGAARLAEAKGLFGVAEQMREEGRLQEAVDTLRKAHALDSANPAVNEALQFALIEEARGLLETDWQTAETLLMQAQELGSGHYAVKGLLRAVADRKREEEIASILTRIRTLQSAGDLHRALALAMEKLRLFPQDVDLQQMHNRLKKQVEALRQVDAPSGVELQPELPLGRSSRISAADKTIAAPPLSSSASSEPNTSTVDHIAIAERQTADMDLEPESNGRRGLRPPAKRFDFLKHKVQIGIGAGTAALLFAAILVFSKSLNHVAAPVGTPKTAPTTIAIKTNPPGAALVINKVIRGVGDGSAVDVPPGNVTIEANLPGYQPLTQQVLLSSGDRKTTELTFQLVQPLLRVDTTLSGGEVSFDDKTAGELQGGQFALDPVPTGLHRLNVKGEHSFGFNFDASSTSIVPSTLTTATGGTLVLVGNTQGKMQVLCNRTGLTLQLDGKDVGGCSLKLAELASVDPGRHNLEVFEKGQSLGAKTVELGPATNLGVYLLSDSSQGTLTVTANLDAFSVSFDGHVSTISGRHNRWRRSFLPGEHTIIAMREGFTVEPASATVKIEKAKDAIQAFAFTAVPATSTLSIKSEPGAELLSNGKSLGKLGQDGSLEVSKIPLGSFPIQLRKKGFSDYQGTVEITAGANVKVFAMKKETSHISVTALPSSAKIVVTKENGEPVQSTGAPASFDLPEGTYTFEALADGYVQRTERIHLAAGESYSHEFRLVQQKQNIERHNNIEKGNWPGWETMGGYQTKTGGGFTSLATGIPSQVSFIADRERKKLMGISRSATLNWAFVASNGSGSVTFHLGDKGLVWEGLGKAKDVRGRAGTTFSKGEHAIKLNVSVSAVGVTVDGASVANVNVAVPSFGPTSFGFRIEGGETLSVKNFSYTSTP